MGKYKTIDICAGIGGIRRGFELTGSFVNILSADNDKYANLSYQHLYHEDSHLDITHDAFKKKVEGICFDVLLAGFPCQTFSAVGKREGFKDQTRGTIFFHLAEIIEKKRPKAFLLENVEGLISHKKGETFQIILETLISELGYKIIGVNQTIGEHLTIFDNQNSTSKYYFNKDDLVLNSKNFGLPQNRPRVYLFGVNMRDYEVKNIDIATFRLPKTNNKIIYKDLHEIIENEVDDKYYLSQGYWDSLKKHKENQKVRGNGFGFAIVNKTNKKHPISNAILATGGSGKERNLIYQYKEGIGNKLVANKKTPLNNEYIRNMTPVEWAKLQGFMGYAFVNKQGIDEFSFPKELSDAQRYKQMGNSVCIPVIEEIAKSAVEILNNMYERRGGKDEV